MKFYYNTFFVKVNNKEYLTYQLNKTKEDDNHLIDLIDKGLIAPVIFDDTLKYALVFNSLEVQDDYNYDDELELSYYEIQSYLLIDTCPIGGCKIEIILNESIDKTDEYNDLIREIDILKNKKGRKSKVNNKKLESLNKDIQFLMYGNIPFIYDAIN